MWLYALLTLLFFFPLQSEESPASPKIDQLPKDAVYRGPYFRFGESHAILGKIEGSAYLVGSQVIVSGVIEGDLLVLATTISITGKVLGNIFLLAGDAEISGEVGGRVFCLGVNVETDRSCHLNKNLFLIGGHGGIGGTIEGGVVAIGGKLDIGGRIKKNVRACAGEIAVLSSAYLEGELRYRSQQPAKISPGSTILGKLKYVPSFLEDLKQLPVVKGVVVGSQIVGKSMNFFYTFVVGFILLRFYPKKLTVVLNRVGSHFWSSFGCGLFIVFLIPLVSIALLVTVVGAPFALTLLALNVIGFYTAKVVPILYFCNKLFRRLGWKPGTLKTLLVGETLYYALCAIPVLGWLFAVFMMLLGLGASISAHLQKD